LGRAVEWVPLPALFCLAPVFFCTFSVSFPGLSRTLKGAHFVGTSAGQFSVFDGNFPLVRSVPGPDPKLRFAPALIGSICSLGCWFLSPVMPFAHLDFFDPFFFLRYTDPFLFKERPRHRASSYTPRSLFQFFFPCLVGFFPSCPFPKDDVSVQKPCTGSVRNVLKSWRAVSCVPLSGLLPKVFLIGWVHFFWTFFSSRFFTFPRNAPFRGPYSIWLPGAKPSGLAHGPDFFLPTSSGPEDGPFHFLSRTCP